MTEPESRGLSCGALIAIAVAVTAVVLGGLGYWSWSSHATGASCEVDGDCTARACLRYGSLVGVCTEVCRSDDDCPNDMECGVAARDRSFTPGGDPERHVCVPTGARLRELLEEARDR